MSYSRDKTLFYTNFYRTIIFVVFLLVHMMHGASMRPFLLCFYWCGQVDLAETDENENECGNENEKGNGRQESYKHGIGRQPYKLYHAR